MIKEVKPIFYSFWCILTVLFFCSFCSGGSHKVDGYADSAKAEKPTSLLQEINIGSIQNHPTAFEGKKVRVRGNYLGWRAKIEPPGITRSDWVIGDDKGAIYVTGLPAKGLDPYGDIGHPLEVEGVVQLNRKRIPYIQAIRVQILIKE